MTTPAIPRNLQQVLSVWEAAERAGDAPALDALLHPQFLFVGPFGFLLDRQQWQERFTSGDLRSTSFAFTPDTPMRHFGTTTVAVGTQDQTGTHQGQPVDGQFRGTLVLVLDTIWLGRPPPQPATSPTPLADTAPSSPDTAVRVGEKTFAVPRLARERRCPP